MTIRAYTDPTGDGFTPRSKPAARGTVLLDKPLAGVVDDSDLLTREKKDQVIDAALVPTLFPVLVGHSEDIKRPDGTARDLTRAKGFLDCALIPAVTSRLGWTIFATGYDLDKMKFSNKQLLDDVRSPLASAVMFGSSYYGLQHPQSSPALLPEQIAFGVDAIERAGLRRSPVAVAPRFGYNDFSHPHSLGFQSFVTNGVDYVLFEDRESFHNLHPRLPANTSNCFWLKHKNEELRAIRFDSSTRTRFAQTMRAENKYTPERLVDETLEDLSRATPERSLNVLYWRIEDIHAGGNAGVDRFVAVIDRLSSAVASGTVASRPLSSEALNQYEHLWTASHARPIQLGSTYAWEKTRTQRSYAEALNAVEYPALNDREKRRFLTLTDEVFWDAAENVDTSSVSPEQRGVSYRLLEEARRTLVELPHKNSVFIAGSFSDELSRKDERLLKLRLNARYKATE